MTTKKDVTELYHDLVKLTHADPESSYLNTWTPDGQTRYEVQLVWPEFKQYEQINGCGAGDMYAKLYKYKAGYIMGQCLAEKRLARELLK